MYRTHTSGPPGRSHLPNEDMKADRKERHFARDRPGEWCVLPTLLPLGGGVGVGGYQQEGVMVAGDHALKRP